MHTLKLGPRMVDSWEAMVSAMENTPDLWWSMDELVEVGISYPRGCDILEATVKTMVWKAVREGIFTIKDRRFKGKRRRYGLVEKPVVEVVQPRPRP